MFLSSFSSCRKDPLAKQPSYQMDNVQFLIIPQLFKQAITSSCGTQGAPHPPMLQSPPPSTSGCALCSWVLVPCGHTWCAVYSSPRLSVYMTNKLLLISSVPCWVSCFTISCAHKLRWEFLPHQWETIITVTQADLCFKRMLASIENELQRG